KATAGSALERWLAPPARPRPRILPSRPTTRQRVCVPPASTPRTTSSPMSRNPTDGRPVPPEGTPRFSPPQGPHPWCPRGRRRRIRRTVRAEHVRFFLPVAVARLLHNSPQLRWTAAGRGDFDGARRRPGHGWGGFRITLM